MRPGRDNIAAPDLPTGLEWIGAEPDSMPALTAGGPAIVHFIDFAQLNSVRTLPYLGEWARRYREAAPATLALLQERCEALARELLAADTGLRERSDVVALRSAGAGY